MEKEEFLELGLIYVREGNLEAALKSLGTALIRYANIQGTETRDDVQTLENLPLELLSYYGMCIALVQNRVEEGLRLCKKALVEDALRPEFYLNLGKVYLKANRKAKALKVFQRGLEVTERNRDIMNELIKLGIRKRQVFGFLPRSHFLNHYIGLLLYKFGNLGRFDRVWAPHGNRSRLK